MGWYRSGKDTTEQYHSVDIRKIRIKRLLQTGGQLTQRWSRCGSLTGALMCWTERDCLVLLYRWRKGNSDDGESPAIAGCGGVDLRVSTRHGDPRKEKVKRPRQNRALDFAI